MVERMAASMSEYGVGVDVLCMYNLVIINNIKQNYPFFTRLLLQYFSKHYSGIVFRIFRKLFSPMMIQSLMRQYDLVDFHAYGMDYLPFMQYCVRKSIPFDITLWGSDIMRANEDAVNRKRYGFEHCRYIKAAENVLTVVSEKYPDLFENKYKAVYWGNTDFDAIEDVVKSFPNVETIRTAFIPEANDKIIVTCGYNGSEGQNHIKIFEAIGRLSKSLLDRIYLLVPLTYGATEEYLLEVEKAVKGLQVPFILYTKRIPVDDIAKIRLVSDVIVNMQDTDAFSGSLQDHLYCKNVLIIGEWLNYVPLDNAGVYYIKTSYDSLTENITKVLNDLASYRQKCEDNYYKMKQLTSWECVLPRWVEVYKS